MSKNILRIFVSGLLVIGFFGLFGFKSFSRLFEDGVTITKTKFVSEKISSPGKGSLNNYFDLLKSAIEVTWRSHHTQSLHKYICQKLRLNKTKYFVL